MTEQTKKPIHKIHVGSGITASIWENTTDNGLLYAVEVERSYKEKGSDTWKNTTGYVGSQILLVSKAYDLAFNYIKTLNIS